MNEALAARFRGAMAEEPVPRRGDGLLVACSGTPVQTQYYLLRSDLEQRQTDAEDNKFVVDEA